MTSVFPIAAGTQSYDWGKIGIDSKAAQYALNSIPDFKLDGSKPYAELWMGTHATLPSYMISTKENLSDYLATHTELFGSKVLDHFPDVKTGSLPFLFKILSIQKALSIQAHPDKNLAEKLYAERPDLYKDANHKPEMAIALTPFTALCGFRPVQEIGTFLSHVPELASLIPHTTLSTFESLCATSSSDVLEGAALRGVFTALMTTPQDLVKTQLQILIRRYKSDRHVPVENGVHDLVVELYRQFPDDIGVFCVYLLNVVKLQPGEAIFLGAGEPHAYVSGDIVETMATSDNVLRAGLTPKTRDIPNLVSSLTYHARAPSAHIVIPAPFSRGSDHTKLYNPPIPEFSVLLANVSAGNQETHDALEGPSLLIVTGGKGKVVWSDGDLTIQEGSVLFIGTNTKVTFEANENLIVFRAFVEV